MIKYLLRLLRHAAMVMAVAMLGLAMTACGGDDKDEPGEGGSAKLTMSQLKGKWAVVTQDYNELWYSLDYNSEDEDVYEIREFTSNNVCKQYENDRGFTLKGGYLYGCSMSDYELYNSYAYSVQNGQMFLVGFVCTPIQVSKNVMLIREGQDLTLYKRLKGFKN